MSYIRCLSNPEGLYIWGTDKQLCIAEGQLKIKTIPIEIFNCLLKKYHKNFGENTKYKGASIKEVYITDKKKKNPKMLWKYFGKYGGHHKMRLSYKKWHIDMWLVTWEYIARRGKE